MKAEFQAGGTGRILSKMTLAFVRGLSGTVSAEWGGRCQPLRWWRKYLALGILHKAPPP